jgi:hypothetical protein
MKVDGSEGCGGGSEVIRQLKRLPTLTSRERGTRNFRDAIHQIQ